VIYKKMKFIKIHHTSQTPHLFHTSAQLQFGVLIFGK